MEGELKEFLKLLWYFYVLSGIGIIVYCVVEGLQVLRGILAVLTEEKKE